MRATTILGVALLALSTAALAHVATVPVENKTNTVPTGNYSTDVPGNSSADNAADPTSNTTANNADQTSLGTVPGDPAATTSAPPK